MPEKGGFGSAIAQEMGAIFVKFDGNHITAAIVFVFIVMCLRYIGNPKLKWAIFAAGFLYGLSFLVGNIEHIILRVAAVVIVAIMMVKEYLLPAKRKRVATRKKRVKNSAKVEKS